MQNVANSREMLIESAKQFKTQWVTLGEHLTKVAAEKLYEKWGFKKFEDYCKVELKLKKATAIKLTNAFFFVTKQEPDLADKGLDLDVVSALKKVKSNDQCSDEVYEEIRELAVNKGRSGSTIEKAFKDSIQEETDKAKEFYLKTQSMTARLKGRIRPIDDIPENFKKNLEEMSDFLNKHIEYIGA